MLYLILGTKSESSDSDQLLSGLGNGAHVTLDVRLQRLAFGLGPVNAGNQFLLVLGKREPSDSDSVLSFDRLLLLER